MKPHLKQAWCIGQINAEFIARMERLLWLYQQPYDPRYPVICFDERPCFLIGEKVEPLAIQPGQVRKEHYAYEKNGSCALLAAIEPLTGRRLAHVRPQRARREYALFLKELAKTYPQAIKNRLAQDNLNTHDQCFLRTVFGGRCLRSGATLRVLLHTQVSQLVKHD